MLAANYSWNKLNKEFADDPIIPAFNTPRHKYNVSISGRDIPSGKGKLGFNVNYKWIQGFTFEGSPQFTGYIPSYDLVDAQINYNYPKWNTTFKLGASNLMNKMNVQTYGGPRIGRLGYFTMVYDFVQN
jgi:iron complex outermembrane recepter protein